MPVWYHAPMDGVLLALPDTDRPEAQAPLSGGGGGLPEVQFAPSQAKINPTNRELRFIVPLTDGPTYLGDLELAVSPQDDLSVDAPRMLELVKPLLTRAAYDHLAAAGADGRLTDVELRAEGVTLAYDAAALALSLGIDLKHRQRLAQSFRAGRGNEQPSLEAASFSGYLNLHAAADLALAGTNKGVIPPSASLDGALRIHGLVIESEGYVSGRQGEPALRRTGTRLVYESERAQLRLTMGDTQIFARQFQASPTVFGLSVSRLYNLIDPQREIRASGAQSFSVLAPSTIETFVNGRSVERRSFQPGNYTLQDFPLAQGSNAVKLSIEDDTGKVRTIDFSVYANQSLVGKGVTEFSAFAGVYAAPTRTGFVYSRDWNMAGFIRRGLSEQVTAGLTMQANKRTQQAGAELLWGGKLGLTGFNFSASHNRQLGNGLAAALTYERLLSFNGGDRTQSIRASAEWRSKAYVFPQVAFGPDATEFRASLGYVRSLGRNRFMAFDGQVSRNRDGRGFAYGARVSGGLDLGDRIALTAEAGYNHLVPRNEAYVRAGLRVRLGERATAQFDADSKGRARASYSNSGGRGTGAWLASADISRDSDNASLNANGGLLTNRADLGVQQTIGWDMRTLQVTDARLSLRAATAFAFANGAFAIGRPVSEAFVIASGHKSLAGKPVYLDPDEKSEAARSGSLGPALEGQLSAHGYRTLIYQVPDAPAGYDLGSGNITIAPPYRGGYRLTVGSDYHLLVIGKLLTRSGEPLALLAGKASELSAPKRPALIVFTSRDGKFGAQGLRPGRWRIEMPTEPATSYEFEVTDSPDGTVRLGELRPIPRP